MKTIKTDINHGLILGGTDTMEQFRNFISLGYFCSVARELEKVGLRDQSSPFDWCISNDFEMVIYAIDNGFKNYLLKENMAQNHDNLSVYKDMKYNIEFYHDFTKYKTLEQQLPEVKKKYERRIQRFLTSVTYPTLFVRYISDEKRDNDGISVELKWIEENLDYIISVIKKYNKKNDIIFIGNSGMKSDIIKIFCVEKDLNDTVARKPLEKNKELYYLLSDFNFANRETNIKRYKKKQKREKSIFVKIKTKVKKKCNDTFLVNKEFSCQY